jgi:glutathione S-transferase
MHAPVALVTLLALLLYIWMVMRVGAARGRLGVEAPAVTGNPEFERHFRVQANTTEGLILFLPSLWIFALYLNDWVAAAFGVVWLVGRFLYMNAYVRDPKTRSMGFGVQAIGMLGLLLGGLGAVIWNLLKTYAHM